MKKHGQGGGVDSWGAATRATRQMLVGSLFVSGMLAGCAPEYAGIVVTVTDLPADTQKLILRPVVGGKTLGSEEFTSDVVGQSQVQLGLRLPRANVGTQVDITVDAVGSKGCVAASASSSTRVDEVVRYEVSLPLKPVIAAVATTLLGVHGRAANDVWAVGDAGTTMHYDGCGWKTTTVPKVGKIRNVYVPSDTGNTAYAVIDPGSVWQWDGTQWSEVLKAPTGSIKAIHGSSGSDIWAAGEGAAGGCILYHNDGTGWLAGSFCQNINSYYLRSVYVLPNSGAFAVGTYQAKQVAAQYKKATNAWDMLTVTMPMAAGNLSAVWAASDTVAWAGGPNNTLVRNNGTGGAFAPDASIQTALGPGNTNVGISSISGTSAQDIWLLVLDVMKTYVFHYNGSAWSRETRLDPYSITGLWANTPTDVWFVGAGGLRLHYDGQSFTTSL
ncbi:MAG TPA: hypothetical protein PKI03_05130 [Pseudomonadota bacterium]|nr:hypothetical protein [Pseudomonadota bacterium]